MKPFISEDFLLHTETAKILYHEFARDMPILDYHCHLPVGDIASDRSFENLTQIWLNGDHYKWRAMRANGIAERFITGDASDYEKFEAWAVTVPRTLRNPLYHWTHLELKRCFGISDKVLNPADNDLIASMISNFQDGTVPGKMQIGSAWWFNDQKHGIERQLDALSNSGLLSRFVGMLTDSRSFLSYPRHEYFRRILCNLLGNDVENGELPDDLELLGGMVKDICYYNAVNYFGFDEP